MPQFDQFSFFNQIFWFFLFFFSFYFLISFFFLPKICYSLKFRNKKKYLNLTTQNKTFFEKTKINLFLNNFYKKKYTQLEISYKQKLNNQKIFKKTIINEHFKQNLISFLNKKYLKKQLLI
jgi:hypothetical protein